MQLSEELCGVQCKKLERCAIVSVVLAQTLLKDVGGNRNLIDNKIVQGANLPKANDYGHKQVLLR